MSRDSGRDPKLLLDMLIAAWDARSFVSGMSKDDFEANRLVQYATVRAIQIVGEEARMVSEETRAGHPEIEWRQIVAMRHRLVHDYTQIDTDIMWDVLHRDLPALITLLEPLVPLDTNSG